MFLLEKDNIFHTFQNKNLENWTKMTLHILQNKTHQLCNFLSKIERIQY